jgi:peptidoglycan-associated lipoprotein
MKKSIFFMLIACTLIIFAAGCVKKQVKPDEQQKAAHKKSEVVSEPIYPVESAERIPPSEKSLIDFKDVLFDYDKYDIRTDGRAVLDSITPLLNKNKELKVLIEGHCDERGTNEYNLALGEKRASAAKDYLISKGLSPDRLSTISYGEEKPVCLEQNENCWQHNRRAHFVVTK